MMNKRDFLKGGATAVVAGAGTTATLAAVRPSLGGATGLASWRAHVGQRFEVDGHAVTLVSAEPAGPAGAEQFSLRFEGALPAGIGDGLHQVSGATAAPLALYLARTPQGLRADFCRLQA
jgi:hypothetical protein